MGLRDWNLLLNVTMKQQDTCMKKVALRLREQERNQCSSKAPTPGFTQPISSST